MNIETIDFSKFMPGDNIYLYAGLLIVVILAVVFLLKIFRIISKTVAIFLTAASMIPMMLFTIGAPMKWRKDAAMLALNAYSGGQWKQVDLKDYNLKAAGINDGDIAFAGEIKNKICTARYVPDSEQIQLRCVKKMK